METSVFQSQPAGRATVAFSTFPCCETPFDGLLSNRIDRELAFLLAVHALMEKHGICHPLFGA